MMRWFELKIPPLLSVALLAAGMWWLAGVSSDLALPAEVRMGLAGPLIVAGFLIAAAGVVEFRRAQTTVSPVSPHQSSDLVQSGIYRYTRNPMYLGFALALLGWSGWLAAPATLLGPVLFVWWINRFQIRPEERALSRLFGNDFKDYRGRVRRWL